MSTLKERVEILAMTFETRAKCAARDGERGWRFTDAAYREAAADLLRALDPENECRASERLYPERTKP